LLVREIRYYHSCFTLHRVVREIARQDKNALNDGDENSNTALHLAAQGGHIRLVESLLDLGAGPEIK